MFPDGDGVDLRFVSDALPMPNDGRSVLPHGLGRSYGDSCIDEGGVLLRTGGLDRALAFDAERGVLRCEAGTSLEEVLRRFVPQGWFPPVVPGTQHVSVGGAIANDIHGKNHHLAGSFGCHVRRLELLRSDGSRIVCGPGDEWFGPTVGGLGLTGLITWAEIQLRRIPGPHIREEALAMEGLDDFVRLSKDSAGHEYTVAWIDSLATGKKVGRGVFLRGDHAPPPHRPPRPPRRRLRIPIDAPGFALNPWTVAAFNAAYRWARLAHASPRIVHYRPFFFPLDGVEDWNRLYGQRGFHQHQCLVPPGAIGAVQEILEEVGRSRQASFLTVLKKFGDVRSPGLLSFPGPGITLALDIPHRGDKTLDLLRRMDRIVESAGGRLYPAKDAHMSRETFQRGYPAWKETERYRDPRFSSSFWRRVA
ncbi:MAG: FAD-dependent oxidoreductase [Thermoplasmatota archaeon]